MTAERKYTDKDVRQDSTLRQIAEEYVVNYGGDFEPLVNAVRMMEEGEKLPTNIIRVVLNCMRHDREVANQLPNPENLQPRLELVTDRPTRKLPRRIPWDYPCDYPESHDGHGWKDPGSGVNNHWCPGVPFAINREHFFTRAVVNRPFFCARGGKLIHIASHEDLGTSILWRPWRRHEYGEAEAIELAVKSLCRYPSIIRKPVLLTREEAMTLDAVAIVEVEFCRHCLDVIDEEVEWWQVQLKKH